MTEQYPPISNQRLDDMIARMERIIAGYSDPMYGNRDIMSALLELRDRRVAESPSPTLEWKNRETRSSLGDLYTVTPLSDNVWVTQKNGTLFVDWKPSMFAAMALAQRDFETQYYRQQKESA